VKKQKNSRLSVTVKKQKNCRSLDSFTMQRTDAEFDSWLSERERQLLGLERRWWNKERQSRLAKEVVAKALGAWREELQASQMCGDSQKYRSPAGRISQDFLTPCTNSPVSSDDSFLSSQFTEMKADGIEGFEETDDETKVQGEVQGLARCKETVNRKLDLKLSMSPVVNRKLFADLLPSDQMELDLQETQGARVKLRWHALGFEEFVEATIGEATALSQSPPLTAALSRTDPPTTRTLMPEKCVLSLELKGTQGARVMLRWHPLGFEEATIGEATEPSQSPPLTAALSRTGPPTTRTLMAEKCVLPSPPKTGTPEKFVIRLQRLLGSLFQFPETKVKALRNATELRRQRSLVEKIALRMRSVGLYKAWARWEEQWRQVKKMRRSAEKVASRWRNMLIAPAFLTLKESAKELKGMRNAGAKVILRWQRLGLSNGFYGWSEHAATQRRMDNVGEKIMLRWQNMLLAPAYSSWNDHVKELLHKKRVLEKVALRMRHAGMCKAWATWFANATELRRQRSLLEKMALRMRSMWLYKGWGRWKEQWRQEKTMRHSAEKVVSRWRSMLLVSAFLGLKVSAKERKEMRKLGAKLMLRWHRLELSNGFHGWMGCAATQRRMAVAAEKIVLRWRHLAISPAMSRWTEYVSDKRRMVQSAEKVVRRMQKMDLWSAFAKLKEVTAVAASERREYLAKQTNQALQCKSQDMRHYSGGWIGRVFKFVSLCVFILFMILSLASVAKPRVEISKPLVSGNNIQGFVDMLGMRGMRAEQSPETEQKELLKVTPHPPPCVSTP
jgi:hypothetical protein